MWKWVTRLVGAGLVGFFGLASYESYRDGYFNLPEFNETSYAISFRNGLRGIVIDPEVSRPSISGLKVFRRLQVANPDRMYLSVPLDVPKWFEDAWSFCNPPTEDEMNWVDQTMPEDRKKSLIGARFDAICKIDVDGETLLRGLIYSVPNL